MLVHVIDIGGTKEYYSASQPQTPLQEVYTVHPFLHLGYSQGRDWLRMSEAQGEIKAKDTYFRLFLVIWRKEEEDSSLLCRAQYHFFSPIFSFHPHSNTCCCCCCITSVVSDSVWPHGQQPTRLPCPWDSPGKNTGVGCHFLLQCIKVKSQSEVAQSCLTLSDPMDCSPQGSSVHGIFQARVLEWGVIAFSNSNT